MDTFIYFIFSFAVYIQICEGLYSCNESIPTISYVESCPKNKTEWNIAARRKNCDSLAALQKCTERENFQYHCLENQWQTMTLEICAPIFYLQGYCARYSTDKKRVEENYENGFQCHKFDESEKCPTRYPSTDAYKYQRCYKLKYQNPTQTAPIVTKKDLRNDTEDYIKTAFLVILALALACVIVFLILFYKRDSLNLERFRKVLTCDVETGADDGAENENARNNEQVTEPLLSNETAPDQEDKRVSATSDEDPARKDSNSLKSTSGNNPFEEDIKPTDNVPTSGQTSDIVTALKQEPEDDASSKPKPDNETASTKKSNTFLNSTSNLDTEGIMKAKSGDHNLTKPKPTDVSLQKVKSDAKNTSKPSKPENEPTDNISVHENNKTEDKSQYVNEKKFKENPSNSNDGHNLKPVSNENIASKSTSPEASDSQQVSNAKSAAVPVSASHTSSSSLSPSKSTKEDMKEVVIDDSKEIPTGMPAESPQYLLFHSSSLSKKNTSGSNTPDNSVSSYDQISQNGKDVSKPILQYQAAANSTPKDVLTSDDAPVSTLSTDNPAPGNDSSSKPMSENNPFDEDTTVSDLSNDNPAPDSCASKPMSAINPFDEDSTPSATSDKDPGPNDSTNIKPISGNNPFEDDSPPSGPPKSNNGRSLKPVWNENIASESTSLEAPDSRQVPNDKAAADPVSESHTSSISVSPFEITKEGTKKVAIDDPKAIPTSMKNTSGSKALDNSASSSDQLSQNGTDVPKPIAQYQAAAKSTPEDVPALDFAPVSTLSTDNPAPGNDSSSKPMSENNPFDEDTTDLSKDNPAPDSCASKPMSAINPFDEDSTPSATSEKDPAPNDSTNLKPISGNNPFEEDTPPSDPPKSNDGNSLKPVSNENIASTSTSLGATDSRQVSNDKSAAVPVSASHTSSTSLSPLKNTKEDMKEVVIDDSKEIPTGMPAASPQSLLFHSSSLSKKNTSGSNAPDNSVSSSDQISQNGTDVSKPILQYQANSTPKDVPTSDDASVLTLSTDNPAPGNDSSSKPMSQNNPFDEDTTVSDLSHDNPAPGSCASKPMSAINPFDEDSTLSARIEKDPAPNDSTNLKPISENNPFEEDTPTLDAGSNIALNDNNASNQHSGSNPFDEDVKLSGWRNGKHQPGPRGQPRKS